MRASEAKKRNVIFLFQKLVEGENKRLGVIYPDMIGSFIQVQRNGKHLFESTSELFAFPIKSEKGVYGGLVLSCNNVNKLSYKRVGMFRMNPEDSRFWLDNCVQQTIRIE